MNGTRATPVTVPEALMDQSAVKDAVMLRANTVSPGAAPEIVVNNEFDPVSSPPSLSLPLCDFGLLPALAISGLMLTGFRRRR